VGSLPERSDRVDWFDYVKFDASGADSVYVQQLSVPEITACMSIVNAALAYAEAGWFVFPVRPGSKVPAIDNWDENSTRDPDKIRRWWTAQPDYNIALHAGRSGAIIFDADIEDLTVIENDGRSDMAAALRGAEAIHNTRRGGERSHYLFLMSPGEMLGNSAGAFARYGQVRGRNGYVVVAPSVHPDADAKSGHYNWRRVGTLTQLPDVLRACLSEAAESADPLTDHQFESFLDTHTGAGCGRDGCRKCVAGPVAWFNAQVADGGSRHEAMRDALPWALSEAMAGCYPAREAFGSLASAFLGVKPGAGGEFYRLAQWAAAQADIDRAHRNDDGLTEDELEAFWFARPELARLQQFARARLSGPWSTLGAVLARAVATIPPHVVLPPIVGSFASLNLFVALVAPSGFGKGASEAVAEDFLVTEVAPFVTTPGSGEGLLKQYAYKRRTGKGQPPEQVNVRNAAIFTVPEVDTFAALAGRGGSTLMPELRKAWMGERLGFGWSDAEKAVAIMAHRYRMTMIVGVQPGRGAVLLDDADGGTPQRFLWLRTIDPDAPGDPPMEPEPLSVPAWPTSVDPAETLEPAQGDKGGFRLKFDADDPYRLDEPAERGAFHVLELPPSVVGTIRAEHLAKRRGEVAETAALDSHGMLARLKVAVGLMWMNGRTDKVSEEDWTLAGTVMAVSNETRASVLAALSGNATKAAKSRGRQDAVREVAKAEGMAEAEEAAIGRVAERIRKALRSANDQPKAAMKRDFGRDKLYFDDALKRLVGVGDVELRPIPGKREDSRSLHIKEGR